MEITDFVCLRECNGIALSVIFSKQKRCWIAALRGSKATINGLHLSSHTAQDITPDYAVSNLCKSIAGTHLDNGGYSIDIPADLAYNPANTA